MREGDQVNGGVIGQQCDVRTLRQRFQHLRDDGAARFITDVNDTAGAMRSFEAVEQFVVLAAIKPDAAAFDQDFVDEARPLLRQNPRSFR